MRVGKEQVLVLGPPGCGKTTDLLGKIEKELANGTAPNKIGFVSFTRKAVLEATARASTKFNLPADDFQYFKTIHSLCFFLVGAKRSDIMGRENLREFGAIVGYQFGGTFDETETGMPTGTNAGDTLLFIDNFARVAKIDLHNAWELANADLQWYEQERFSTALARYKASSGLCDFTDLLSKTVIRAKSLDLDVVFIDEAQDLSALQWQVLQVLFVNVPRVFIAGDDDQSIYKWSGADVDTFLNLPGKKEMLTQSYRVPQTVHKMATNIIGQVRSRYKKPYLPRNERGEIVIASSLEQVQFESEGTTLLLSRNVHMLKNYEHHLRTRGISYIMRGGFPSVKPAHIESILTWEALRKGENVFARKVKKMYEFMKTGNFLRRGAKTSIDDIHDEMLVAAPELQKDHGLCATLPIWHDALENIEIDQREYYLTMLRLGRKLQEKPRVTINTIHGVKGGEADHVVVSSDMSYRTYLEYQKQPDNEHRVAYVAVTRSKSKLTIVQPGTRLAYPY